MRILRLTLLLLTCLAAAQSHAQVCRVTTAGTDSGNGSDWNTQAMDLHTSLGDTGCDEIWVAGGVYKPGAAGDRDTSFTITREVEVYGGFDGTETMLSERDPAANLTSLSGDIDDNDTVNADGVTETAADIAGNNSYHVVYIDGTTASGPITATTVLDGFIITAGLADGSFPENSGGGLFCAGDGSGNECSPVLNDMTFSGNSTTIQGSATGQGGAIYNWAHEGTSSPALNKVTFSGNRADRGGAMFNNGYDGVSSPVLNNVTFSGNSATITGGAMFNDGNSTGVSSPELINVTFSSNSAGAAGGAMLNQASNGVSNPVLRNVILWDNGASEIQNQFAATTTINDSIVQGGCPDSSTCDNVIDADPLLGPLADNGGFTQTMLPGAAGAAINAGNNATCLSEDQRGISRPQGPDCDIGAVEFDGGFDLAVRVNGEGTVDAAADPAPLDGGITGCDVAGQGQPQCTATYTEDAYVTLNLTPATGWQTESANGCDGILTANTYHPAPVVTDCLITVAFAREQHILQYRFGFGGSIIGDTHQTVEHGSGGTTVTAVPDTGYRFVQWSDGSTDNPRTDTDVAADLIVTAEFGLNQFTLEYLAGPGGSISGDTPQTVEPGFDGTPVTAVPDTGYHFVQWSDGSTDDNPRTDTNVTADLSVTAEFAINQYTVTPAAVTGMGTISPDSAQTVDHGELIGFTVTPETDWNIHSVTGTCPGTLAGSTYTAGPVTADCTVEAAFFQARLCRVTLDGTDTGDGSDWDTQAMDLHTALGDINCTEIWVAGGVYKPHGSDRSASFTIAREAEVYGGFSGTETMLDERDPAVNPTILSGDIDNNDNINADGVTETVDDIAGANSYHVVWIDGTTAVGPITATTVLDGFVITAGLADDFSTNEGHRGGGLFCAGDGSGNECSPTLGNMVFSGNSAAQDGGAMFNDGSSGGISNPALNNVAFSGNYAIDGGAMHNDGRSDGVSSPVLNYVSFSGNNALGFGGAMFNHGGNGGISSPALNHVAFDGNSGNQGGALYNAAGSGVSSPVLNSVTFSGNSSSNDNGGAMFNNGGGNGVSSPVLNNVTFSDNSAPHGFGGAMFNDSGSGVSSPVLNNVTFSGNSANLGGAMMNQGHSISGTSNPVLNNVILWGNDTASGPAIYNSNATPEIHDSIVQGGCPDDGTCDNVIDQDPLLGPLADNGGFTQTMLPGITGAAVDAGNNATCLSEDQRGIPRPQGPACDIGAVELDGGFDLAVRVNGEGTVDAAADPAPLEGGITGCDEAGQGQARCAATYAEDDTVTLDLTPAAGWHIESAGGCDGALGGTSYTTAPVMADCTVQVVFAINQYTLEYFAGPNGSVSGDTLQTVDHGADGTPVTAVPDTGYHFVQWSDGSSANPRTETNVTSDLSVTAEFAINQFTLVYLAGPNGSITGDTPQTVDHGADGTPVIAVPDFGYHFVQWSDGSSANPRTDSGITADLSVTAGFAIIPPELSLMPGIWDFGAVQAGGSALSDPFVVDNSGGSDLVIGMVTIEGPAAGDFQLEDDICSGKTVAPGDFCGFSVRFTPTAAGIRRAAVRVPGNAPESPAVAGLIGTSGVLFFDGFEDN